MTSRAKTTSRVMAWLALIVLLSPAQTHGVFAQAGVKVSFPGNYGEAIGAPSWDPADAAVRANDDDGDGTYTLILTLPRGDYEFKVAIDGSWAENYGRGGALDGANIPLSVKEESEVVLSFRQADRVIGATVGGVEVVRAGEPVDDLSAPPPAPGDGEIDRDAILHQSRSDLYRTPFGAQPTGTDVTLRLRTADGDVEGVRLLVDELTGSTNGSLPMQRVATDGDFDWWQTTLNTGDAIAIHNYKFEIDDGATTVFYGDDELRDGGAGTTSSTRPAADAGWDIYTYLPDFAAPAWAADAIIYQIFPDRFRNGDTSNDPQEDDWAYPEERGHAFPVTPWNTIVPDTDPFDPAVNPWYATWNSTFYGGDLQGVQEKLDYLQSLGVNTIYCTPIQEAATNHRYDARDYRQVDDALAVRDDAEASMALFDQFAAEVKARGMHLILDAVPNHTSSDSPMFDLYGRWDTVGACESEQSVDRDLYLFEPASPPGSGACAGDTNYRGFFNLSTLPQANTASEAVIDEWNGEDSITKMWLEKPGVDGWRVDTVYDVSLVNPHFFESFRTAAKAANPDALLIAETWPEANVRERLLGDEFDTTMNYRFAWAVLGFLLDKPFVASNDILFPPLTATRFDDSLRSLQEDYPPAAFASAMNLLDSHDTQRAVRILDHDPIDWSTLTPSHDFADGRKRLALAAVLQFTLPGSPTVYYGDEVGLVGFGSDPTRDDPHNRQPYPWPDEAGYDSLPAWRKQDASLLAHYQRLGKLRSEHSFLRTGLWTTLLTDDAGVYAYLRKDTSGAAVVIVNRSEATQSVTLSLTGMAPFDAALDDAFSGDKLALDSRGGLTVDVAPMGFRLLITQPGIELDLPEAPTVEAIAGSGAVTLTIGGAVDGEQVAIYRSLVDGGFTRLATFRAADSVSFVDAAVTNGVTYYYRASRVGADGLEGLPSDSADALPSAAISSAVLGGPLTMTHTVSAITPTQAITGVVTVAGVTEGVGEAKGLLAELGYLPQGVSDYAWIQGEYAGDLGGSDVYAARLLPESAGDSIYRWRFSNDQGRSWVQSDAGILTVLPSQDGAAPRPPFRLDKLAESGALVSFAWRFSRPSDLAGYRACRADLTADESGCATALTLSKESNVLTDTSVATGHTYSYTVRVFDTSFNFSEPSQAITLTAAPSMVDVTFRVGVPPETPPSAQVYIAGDNADLFGVAWDPDNTPLVNMGDGIWEFKRTVKDGAQIQYKYTRGSWETVEQWGTISGLTNRKVTVARQADGTMLVDDTSMQWDGDAPDDHLAILNWRDPLVSATGPAAGSSGPVDSVSADFSIFVQTADPQAVIAVTDAGATVAGKAAADGPQRFVWIPDSPLSTGTYTATVFNVGATTPMVEP